MKILDNYGVEISPSSWPYEHTQAQSSNSWTVLHRFGYKPAAITVENGSQLLLADIDHVNTDAFTVSFNFGQTGIVRCR